MQSATMIGRGLIAAAGLAAVLFAAPVAATGVDCAHAMSQNDMNTCAQDSYNASDTKLNAVWASLLAKLDTSEKAQIRETQKVWIGYRDAECKFSVRENEGGSIYPTVWFGCLNEKTTARTKELQAHLDCASGKDSCTE